MILSGNQIAIHVPQSNLDGAAFNWLNFSAPKPNPASSKRLLRGARPTPPSIPIIYMNRRGNKERKQELKDEAKRCKLLNFKNPADIRYNERSNVERVNGRLKDEFGGKMVRVRGHAKVMTHLMFGIIVLTADQLIRFVT